jgi:hypothetical protein
VRLVPAEEIRLHVEPGELEHTSSRLDAPEHDRCQDFNYIEIGTA